MTYALLVVQDSNDKLTIGSFVLDFAILNCLVRLDYKLLQQNYNSIDLSKTVQQTALITTQDGQYTIYVYLV